MRILVCSVIALGFATSAYAQEKPDSSELTTAELNAQSAGVSAVTTQAAPAAAVAATVAAPPAPISAPQVTNAILRSGTPVHLRMMEEVTTKKKAARVGQRFRMETAAPIEVEGIEVIPVGTPAWGEITSVRNKGMWGKSGKLEARVLNMRVNGRLIRLSGNFDDKGITGTAGVVGALVVLPVAGFFVTGTSATLPRGGGVSAFIDEDVELSIAKAAPAPLQVNVPAAPAAPAAPSATEGSVEAAEASL